jgi:hypothetical protein
MQNYNIVEKQYNEDGTIFQNYKVILNDDSHFYVPLDETNTDYQAIQEWIAEGNTVIDNGGGE